MNDLPLFSYVPSRPIPTSMAAAGKMANTARYWENRVLEALEIKPMATEDLVKFLGGKDRNIQPATSRLRRKGKIRPSGMTKENENGNECIVWEIG